MLLRGYCSGSLSCSLMAKVESETGFFSRQDTLSCPDSGLSAADGNSPPVSRLGQGPGSGDVPRGRELLARLPPDPIPRRPRGARPALPASPRQGRTERADVLRAGTEEPLLVLRQRQSDPH